MKKNVKLNEKNNGVEGKKVYFMAHFTYSDVHARAAI